GRIRIERIHGSDDVDIPITPEVQAACHAMPKVASHLYRHCLWQAALKGRARQRLCKVGCRHAVACMDSRRQVCVDWRKPATRRTNLWQSRVTRRLPRCSVTPSMPTGKCSRTAAWPRSKARPRTPMLQTQQPRYTNRALKL